MDAEASRDLIFSVHFGKFYMIDAERCFGRQQGSMSCADIETAVANGKNNQKIGMERPEFDAYSVVPNDRAALLSSSSPIRTQSSTNYANRSDGMRTNKGDGFAGRKGLESITSSSSKYVSTSFWSSVPVKDHESMAVGTQEIIENKFRAIAKNLGYQQIAWFVDDDGSATRCVRGDSEDVELSLKCGPISGTTLTLSGTVWKIEVVPSASYSTHVSVTRLPKRVSCPDSEASDVLGCTSYIGKENNLGSENMEVGSPAVHERFLAWLHATLVCAHDTSSVEKNIEAPDECCDENEGVVKKESDSEVVDSFRHHDLRIKVGNNKRVSRESQLYEAVMPGGHLPVEMNEAGRPTVRPDTGLKENVTFIRRVKSRIVFGSPGLLAHLQRGRTGEQDSEDGVDESSDLNADVKMALILTIGTHYEGVGLQEEVPFIDLSLDGDMSEVRKWIQGQGQGNLEVAKQSLQCTIEEVLRVSERIREFW